MGALIRVVGDAGNLASRQLPPSILLRSQEADWNPPVKMSRTLLRGFIPTYRFHPFHLHRHGVGHLELSEALLNAFT